MGLFSLLALGAWSSVQAQVFDPVQWSVEAVRVPESDKVELKLTATIEEGWHLYSQQIPEGGPIPTTFSFKPDTHYSLTGTVKEPKPIVEYDPNFEMELRYFGHKAAFVQTIRSKTYDAFDIAGEVEFMVCDETQCLPPKYVEFVFRVPKGTPPSEKPAVPGENSVDTLEESGLPTEEVGDAGPPEPSDEAEFEARPTEAKSGSLWGIFAFGFGGGLLALLMPCIFPMIPLTVSFFTKQSKTKAEGVRKALVYGISIVLLYVGLGMLVTVLTGNSSVLNQLSTNPTFNIVFFVLFVVFALSFFGAFEITLPSAWVNKADEASSKGGWIGIFFMAFTLALVSFSCTGPIIGSLLVDAATKGQWLGPAVGMLGFSLALAVPFTLFAAFPGWMNSLPRSGGWLNTVKVSLGFIELAFALKFLSTADMALQAGWLKRELFLALWIGIFLLWTAYLLGLFRLPHDSESKHISVGRLALAIVSGSFAFYLIPGLWGAPLNAISGFPPPMFYSESPNGLGENGAHPTSASADLPEGADPEHCPHGLACFHDYEQGLAYAKSVNKPILLDFTGWGCVNCRKMEEQVWIDPRVLQRLSEQVVLISLYVDERTPLPESEQYYSEVLKSKVRNIGNKWSEFQTLHFQTNSQPYYVFVGHDGLKPLIPPTAYDPDVQYYVDWLDAGIRTFQKAPSSTAVVADASQP
ncbi:DUF255 domain-containing protein [bacterium]|nr:DUF255 domain-containing protein [bacterium]